MKKYLLFFFVILLFLVSCQQEKKEPIKQEKSTEIVTTPKIIFVVVGKNLNFNEMKIDTVIKTIFKYDSLLLLKQINADFYMKPQIIKAYNVEDITCTYLKERFKEYEPGTVVFEYSGKLLVKTKDGVIKVYHYHLEEMK